MPDDFFLAKIESDIYGSLGSGLAIRANQDYRPRPSSHGSGYQKRLSGASQSIDAAVVSRFDEESNGFLKQLEICQ
jgi:hypothetical protein